MDVYGDYMMLLHVMGYHDEAWSVLSQVGGFMEVPVLLGLRMDGRVADEQIKWLKKKQINPIAVINADKFAFSVYALDRNPGLSLSKKLETVRDQIAEPRSGAKEKADQKEKRRPSIPPAPNEKDLWKKFADPILPFSDGYALLKKKQFTEAYENLKDRFLDDPIRKDMFSFAIPYLTWSAVKSGKVSEVEPYLAEYKKELGVDLDYYLSQALLSVGRKDHREAIKDLEFAQYYLGYFNGERLLPAWYQLAEICEWLYEDSKLEGYRELLLKIVKLRQTSSPMNSWAYSFEAKYTKSEADRTRALAMTLYLDKQSERIAQFSEKEKLKALEWLKKNNPFLQQNKGEPGPKAI
jgi:hypothetical protein